MIVPKMTYGEKRNQFLHDYKAVHARANHTYRQLVTGVKRRHQTHATEVLEWTTSARNKWLAFFEVRAHQVNFICICISIDHGGLPIALEPIVVDTKENIYVAEYSMHFFKRYNERLKLEIVKPMQTIRHYFKHNLHSESYIKSSRTELGDLKFFQPVNGGVILGTSHDEEKWMQMKTFISNDMLKATQVETVEYLKNYKLDHPNTIA